MFDLSYSYLKDKFIKAFSVPFKTGISMLFYLYNDVISKSLNFKFVIVF